MLVEPSNAAVTGRSTRDRAMPESFSQRATTRHHLPTIIRRSRTSKTGAAAVAKNNVSGAEALPVAKTGASPSCAKTDASFTKTGESSSTKTGQLSSVSPVTKTGSSSSAKTRISAVPKTGALSTPVKSGESPVTITGIASSTKTCESSSTKNGASPTVTPITKTGSSSSAKISISAVSKTSASPTSVKTGESPITITGVSSPTKTGKSSSTKTGESPCAKTGALSSVTPITKTGMSSSAKTSISTVPKTGAPSTSVKTGEPSSTETVQSSSTKTGASCSVTPTTRTGATSSAKTSLSAVSKTGASTIAKTPVPALQTATSSAPRHVIVDEALRTADEMIVANMASEARETETVQVPKVVHAESTIEDDDESNDDGVVDIEGALFIDETVYEAEAATDIVGSPRDFASAASLLDACYKQLVADAKASDPDASNVKVVLNIKKVNSSDAEAYRAQASDGKAFSRVNTVKASSGKAVSMLDKGKASDVTASDGNAVDAKAVLKVNQVKTCNAKASNAKASNAKASNMQASQVKTVSVVSALQAGLAGEQLKTILRERTARAARIVEVPARRVTIQDASSQTCLFSFVGGDSIVSFKEDDEQYTTIIPTKYQQHTSAAVPPAKALIPPPPTPTPSPPPADTLPLLGMTRLIVGDSALPLFARSGRVMVEIPGQMLADRGFFDDSPPADGRRPSLTLGDDTLAMEKVDGKYVVEVPKRLLESLAETRTAEGTAPDPEGPPIKMAAAAVPDLVRKPPGRRKSAKRKGDVSFQAGTPISQLTDSLAVTVPVVTPEPLAVAVNGSEENGSEANGFEEMCAGFLRRALQMKSSDCPPNKKSRTMAAQRDPRLFAQSYECTPKATKSPVAQSDSPLADEPVAIKTPVAQSNSSVADAPETIRTPAMQSNSPAAGAPETIKAPVAQSDTLDADTPEAISTPEAQGGVPEEPPHYLAGGLGERRRKRTTDYKSSKRRKVEKMFRELSQPEVPLSARTRRFSRMSKAAEGNPQQSETSSEGLERPRMPEVMPGGSATLINLPVPSGMSIQSAVELEVSNILRQKTSQEPLPPPGSVPDNDLGKSGPEITPQSIRVTLAGERAKGILRRKPYAQAAIPAPPVSKPTLPVIKQMLPVVKPTLPVIKQTLPVIKQMLPVIKPTVPVIKPMPKVTKPAKPTLLDLQLKMLLPKSRFSSDTPPPLANLTPGQKWLAPKPQKTPTPPVSKTAPPPLVAMVPRWTRRGGKPSKVEAGTSPAVETSATPDETATTSSRPPDAPPVVAAATDNSIGIRQVNDRLLKAAFEDWTECVKRDESTGNIPLHQAVLDGDTAAVRKQCALLNARKASVDVLNNDRETPLHLALKLRLGDAVRELRRRGARLAATDDVGNTALHLAVVHALPDGVAALLEGEGGRPGERPPLEALNDEGYAPLHLAALHNNVADTNTLLKHKADVDQKDAKSGRTPLFIAVENNLKDIVRLLLIAGASISEQNYSGQTPMSAANELGDSLLLT